jgi:hypothetical protein
VQAYKAGYEVPAAEQAMVRSEETTFVNFNLQVTGAVGPSVVRVWATYNGLEGNNIGTFVSLRGLGVPVNNTFYAEIAPGASAARVAFTLNGETKVDTNGADGWSAQFDMSEQPAGYHSLQVRAYDFQGREGPAYTAIVHVVSKPISEVRT